MTRRSPCHRAVAGLALLSGLSLPAQAGLLQGLLGPSADGAAPAAQAGRHAWAIDEFSRLQLVAREAGSPPNEHPAAASPSVLGRKLAALLVEVDGKPQPLFATDEVERLQQPLAQALATAGPDQDVLLLSTYRRDPGFFSPYLAVTARLFVQAGQLQLIVHDARLDGVYRGRTAGVVPTPVYGSRDAAGSVRLGAGEGALVRADWVALPLRADPAAAGLPAAARVAPSAPATAPTATAAAAATATPSAAPASLAPPAPPTPPAVAPRAAEPRPGASARGAEIEERLTTLQRLRDRGLITEDEYQQKRREILQSL